MKSVGEIVHILRRACIAGVAASALFCVAPFGFAEEGAKQGPGTTMKVSGVVAKVQTSHVVIKTLWGQMTIASTAVPRASKSEKRWRCG